MKKFKFSILLVLFTFGYFSNIFSQTFSGVTSISNYSACPGSIISVPLSIVGSPRIASLSLELDYDGSVLSFLQTNLGGTGVISTYDSLFAYGGQIVGAQSTTNGTMKMLRMGWFSSDANSHPVGSSGTGLLCNIRFRYFGGSTSINFNNSVARGNMCEYSTIDNNNIVSCIDIPTSSYYINGSVSPNSITTPPLSAFCTSPICPGSGTSLGFNGGVLGTNAVWTWSSGSCGGLIVGTGSSLVVYPTVTTVYYIQAVEPCGQSLCVSTTCVVKTLSVPGSIISGLNAICANTSTTLGVIGGSLGSGANWFWYDGSCGGNYLYSGSVLNINISSNTTYYVMAIGECNTTSCLSLTISVYNYPAQPSSISGNLNPQFGNNEQYSVNFDSNISLYTWTAPSTWVGTSNSNSINFLVGAMDGNISVTPSNVCGIGPSRTIFVKTGYSLSGYFTYDNIYSTPLDSVVVYLKQNSIIIDSTRTDLNGYYEFSHVNDGIYNINGSTHKPCGGINGTDILVIQRDFLNVQFLTSSITLHAGDVNNSSSLNGTDLLYIQRYFLNIDKYFPRGVWIFEEDDYIPDGIVPLYYKDTVSIAGSNFVQDIKGLCVGDPNGSNVPGTGAKSSSKVSIKNSTIKKLSTNDYSEIPVTINENLTAGAISLIFTFPKNLVEILDVKLCNKNFDGLMYNVQSNNLRIVWSQDKYNSINLKGQDTLFLIKIKTKDNFSQGDVIGLEIENNPLCEFADPFGNSINHVELNIPEIIYSTSPAATVSGDNSLELYVYPNPASNFVELSYTTIKDGNINISVFNSFGEKISVLEDKFVSKGNYRNKVDISNLPSGIYSIRLMINNNEISIRKVVFFK